MNTLSLKTASVKAVKVIKSGVELLYTKNGGRPFYI